MILGKLMSYAGVLKSNVSYETEISSLTIDSRHCSPGCIFVALPGTKTDGLLYAGEAIKAGAVAVICEKPAEEGIPYILVDDARKALAAVSCEFYGNPSRELKMIGVTGTNGKTTVACLIKELIEKTFGAKTGLIGTYINLVGEREIPSKMTTPQADTLQRWFREMADAGCEYCVMEVSSHALALNRVDGIEFDVGIFTNLSHDHLDFHETMENYREEKAKLFDRCKTAIFNMDDASTEYLMERSAAEKKITFSCGKNEADVVAKAAKIKVGSVEFQTVIKGGIARIELGIPGKFSVYNGLAVISCGLALGMPLADISKAMKSMGGVKGRMEVLPVNRDYTVLIDYAVTPDALENVLLSVKEYVTGRLVLLFGCGGDRDRKKRPEMGAIACRIADYVVVTSDNPRIERPMQIIEDILEGMKGGAESYIVIEDRREAIAWALDNMAEGDMLILAGKGHETYQEIDGIRYHLDEREVVSEHLGITL